MRTAGLAIVAVSAFLTCAHAQERYDLSISSGATLGKDVSSSTSSVSLSPHYSALFFGSVRYHFNHLHAVEVNIGHANSSQIFSLPPDTYKITTGVLEYGGAYVLTPFHDRRLQPFLLAGVAGLHWTPSNQYIDHVQVDFGAGTENSLAFLYGGGADYRVWRRIALRVQYRGFVYRTPDFGVSNLFLSAKDHMAQPSAGVVVRF